MNEINTWRVIDTGLRSAAENMALNKTLLEAHQEGLIPHTLRFLQFTPCALLGFHQSAQQELRLDYCKENNIEVQRRITGGGAIYFDETQIGWELYLDKKTLGTADMSAIARKICEAAAEGISQLGVNARFRPRNDIEVDGKKISGTGGAFDGNSILYQGTLLIDFDIERMLRVLRIPAEKLSDKAIESARERVANLKDLLGEVPDMALVKKHITTAFAKAFAVNFSEAGELSDNEQAIYQQSSAGRLFQRAQRSAGGSGRSFARGNAAAPRARSGRHLRLSSARADAKAKAEGYSTVCFARRARRISRIIYAYQMARA